MINIYYIIKHIDYIHVVGIRYMLNLTSMPVLIIHRLRGGKWIDERGGAGGDVSLTRSCVIPRVAP